MIFLSPMDESMCLYTPSLHDSKSLAGFAALAHISLKIQPHPNDGSGLRFSLSNHVVES